MFLSRTQQDPVVRDARVDFCAWRKAKSVAVKISHEQIAMHSAKSIRTYHAAFKFALPSFPTDSKRAHEGHITKKNGEPVPSSFLKKKGGKHITNWNAITQIAPRNSLLQKVYSIKKNLPIARMHIQVIGILFSCHHSSHHLPSLPIGPFKERQNGIKLLMDRL